MGLAKIFNKTEPLISLDIGSSAVKLIELNMSGPRPVLVNAIVSALPKDIFNNNVLTKAAEVGELISSLLDEHGIADKRVVTAMPGPSVFTKKIGTQKLALDELKGNVQFEAGNYIPHPVDQVKLDFHIVGEVGRNQLEILIVAVKNEIIESFVDCLLLSGLETAVVDVDYFALQNIFELSYPEEVEKTVALVNIGARYAGINICRGGQSLFCGDVAVGGRQITEAIATCLGCSVEEAERLKKEKTPDERMNEAIRNIVDQNVEQVAGELNRQLSFFWNAAGADDGIDSIVLAGGGALLPRLVEELSEKTGIQTSLMDPLRGIDCPAELAKSLEPFTPSLAVGLGMGIRQPGDRIVSAYD